MQKHLEKRLTELEAEYRTGQQMLTELEAKRTDLQQTLLRISGAIQVLKEILTGDNDAAGEGVKAPQRSSTRQQRHRDPHETVGTHL